MYVVDTACSHSCRQAVTSTLALSSSSNTQQHSSNTRFETPNRDGILVFVAYDILLSINSPKRWSLWYTCCFHHTSAKLSRSIILFVCKKKPNALIFASRGAFSGPFGGASSGASTGGGVLF